MVMYASKRPRLSDGFHDTNEAHAYEMDKYPHKTRDHPGTNSRDRRERERARESPRGGPGGGDHGGVNQDSPRNNSDKSYYQKSRSRGVDQKGSSGSNTSSNHQVNAKPNSHSTPDHGKRIKGILAEAKEWSEHVSSSQKKYYYNCKTEVSQWEKPKAWLERETLQQAIKADIPASHTNARTTSKGIDKHSSNRPQSSQPYQQHHPHRTQERAPSTSSSSTSSLPESRKQQQQHSSSSAGQSQRRYNSQSNSSSGSSKPGQGGPSENSRSHPPSRGSARPSERPEIVVVPAAARKEEGRTSDGRKRLDYENDRASASSSSASYYNAKHSPSLTNPVAATTAATASSAAAEGNGTDRRRVERRSPGNLKGRPPPVSLATDGYGNLRNLVRINSVGKRDRNESPRMNSSPSSNVSTVSPLPTMSPKIVRTPLQNKLQPHEQQQDKRNSSSTSPISHHPHHHHHPPGEAREEAHQRLSQPSPMSIASVSDISSPAHSYPSPETGSSTTPLSHCSNQPADRGGPGGRAETAGRERVDPPDKRLVVIKGSPPRVNNTLETNYSINDDEEVKSRNCVDSSLNSSSEVLDAAAENCAVAHPPRRKEDDFQFREIVFSAAAHSKFYSEELIKHRFNWPVEQLEKQAHLVQRESYRLGVENYSQVMMDLKFARSLVRTTEIQANVQASRIVFLRQQVKELEKLKNENAYMT